METKRSSIGLKIRPIMLLAALTLALPWLSRPANAAAVTVHIETAFVDGTGFLDTEDRPRHFATRTTHNG